MQSKPIPAADVREALERVLASATFRGANRSRRLLEFLVQAVLGGRAQQLKEYTLGADALGRGPAFDPRVDPIARVEASRLRKRLELYYATEGAADPIVISLPAGGYVPGIATRDPSEQRGGRIPEDAEARSGAAITPTAARKAGLKRLGAPLWFAGGVLVAAAAAYVLAPGRYAAPVVDQRPTMRLDVATGAPGSIAADVGNSLVITPDGRTVVLVMLHGDGGTRLYARPLEELAAIELPGTIGARAPFVSPDGRWVGFWAEGQIRKTLLDGRASPITLADAPDLLGASWSERGEIIATVSRDNVLWRLPEDGGELTPLIDFGAAAAHPAWAQILPGGQAVLYTANVMLGSSTSIVVTDLDGGIRRTLLPSGSYARYVSSGHLVYLDRGTLFAVRFDLERLEIEGVPVPVLTDVAYGAGFGFAHFDVAHDGTLVYLRSGSSGLSTIAWLDGDRVAATLSDEPGLYGWPRLSPDGQRLAYSLVAGSAADLWVQNLNSGIRMRLTSVGGSQTVPLWTPDSQLILYQQASLQAIAWLRADGGEESRVLLSGGLKVPRSFTPDGRRLAYYEMGVDTGFDLWTVTVDREGDVLRAGEPELFRGTRAFETYPTFSPDGHWIAYGSNESGIWEVYVRAFPDDGRQVRVSSNGGRIPAWSNADQRIFYTTNDHYIMAARYDVRDGAFVPETPGLWSTRQLADTGVLANFDVAPDGERVVALLPVTETAQPARDRFTLMPDFFGLLP